jgi:hypothetical protein
MNFVYFTYTISNFKKRIYLTMRLSFSMFAGAFQPNSQKQTSLAQSPYFTSNSIMPRMAVTSDIATFSKVHQNQPSFCGPGQNKYTNKLKKKVDFLKKNTTYTQQEITTAQQGQNGSPQRNRAIKNLLEQRFFKSADESKKAAYNLIKGEAKTGTSGESAISSTSQPESSSASILDQPYEPHPIYQNYQAK